MSPPDSSHGVCSSADADPEGDPQLEGRSLSSGGPCDVRAAMLLPNTRPSAPRRDWRPSGSGCRPRLCREALPPPIQDVTLGIVNVVNGRPEHAVVDLPNLAQQLTILEWDLAAGIDVDAFRQEASGHATGPRMLAVQRGTGRQMAC